MALAQSKRTKAVQRAKLFSYRSKTLQGESQATVWVQNNSRKKPHQNTTIKDYTNPHTCARVDPPPCLQEPPVKLSHIHIIPLEQDPDSTA